MSLTKIIKTSSLLGHDLLKEERQIKASLEFLLVALKTGHTIFICGNGGSALDASHFSSELVGRAFNKTRRPISALSLTSDLATISAIANDYNYEEIFSKQLEALAKIGDILVVISTSGNSKNLLKAVSISKLLGMISIGILGPKSGSLTSVVDVAINVPRGENAARIQEVHRILIHYICEEIEKVV